MTVITTITTSGTESTWAERMHLDCSKQYMYFGNVYTVNYIPLEVECGSLPSRKKQAVDETTSPKMEKGESFLNRCTKLIS